MTEQQANSTDSGKPGHYATENASTHKSRWWIWLILGALVLGGVAWWQLRGPLPRRKPAVTLPPGQFWSRRRQRTRATSEFT